MRPNPRSRDYPKGSEAHARMDEFNHAYSGVLHLLDECFNGSPRLLAVATGAMYGLKEQAVELMKLPSRRRDDRRTELRYVPPELRHHVGKESQRIVVLHNGRLVYGDAARGKKIVSESNDAITWNKTEVIGTRRHTFRRRGQSSTKPLRRNARADSTARRPPTRAHGDAPADSRRTWTSCARILSMRGVLRAASSGSRHEGADDSDVRARVIAHRPLPVGLLPFSLDEDGPTSGGPLRRSPSPRRALARRALWVTGGVPVRRSDGQPFETRNRVTLCRCGQSANKPLCDGTHRRVEFRE
jgi:hypothetical protein